MKDNLFEFRCWLEQKFREGKINNISRIQHLIDVYYEEKTTNQEVEK